MSDTDQLADLLCKVVDVARALEAERDQLRAELAAERERVERLRMFLYDVLDYAGWENPAYVERVRALHPGDLDEEPPRG